MDLQLRLDHQLVAVQEESTVHAMLQLRAPEAPAPAVRAPLSLAIVIDRSGSMSGGRLETAKECVLHLAKRLAPTDELAIVAYDDEVNVVLPLSPVNESSVRAALDAIWVGGSTNLSGGWLKGMETLRATSADRVRRVLLLTDGQANVGIVDHDVLKKITREAGAQGISTTTIGFGDDFDEHLLSAMADAGGGGAHFAATPDAAPGIFANEFEGLVTVVAQNVSVEIRRQPEVDVVAVLNQYPMVWLADAVQIEIGDAYGGEERSVVFELHVPALEFLGVIKVADLVLRYVAVGEQVAAHEVTVPLMINAATAEDAATAALDHQVVDEVLVLKAAKARDEARKRFDEGDFDGGHAALKATAEELRAAPPSPRTAELLAEAAQLDLLVTDMQPVTWSAANAKAMHYQSRDRTRRRTRPPKSS